LLTPAAGAQPASPPQHPHPPSLLALFPAPPQPSNQPQTVYDATQAQLLGARPLVPVPALSLAKWRVSEEGQRALRVQLPERLDVIHEAVYQAADFCGELRKELNIRDGDRIHFAGDAQRAKDAANLARAEAAAAAKQAAVDATYQFVAAQQAAAAKAAAAKEKAAAVAAACRPRYAAAAAAAGRARVPHTPIPATGARVVKPVAGAAAPAPERRAGRWPAGPVAQQRPLVAFGSRAVGVAPRRASDN